MQSKQRFYTAKETYQNKDSLQNGKVFANMTNNIQNTQGAHIT